MSQWSWTDSSSPQGIADRRLNLLADEGLDVGGLQAHKEVSKTGHRSLPEPFLPVGAKRPPGVFAAFAHLPNFRDQRLSRQRLYSRQMGPRRRQRKRRARPRLPACPHRPLQGGEHVSRGDALFKPPQQQRAVARAEKMAPPRR